MKNKQNYSQRKLLSMKNINKYDRQSCIIFHVMYITNLIIEELNLKIIA